MALTLATIRELPRAERHLRDGRLARRALPADRLAARPHHGNSSGSGGSARRSRGAPSHSASTVVYHGRAPQPGAPYLYYPTLEGMARACDILMVAAPGGAQTRHIVNRAIIDAVGPDGVIINVSRGSLVDEAALIAALAEGRLLGAGLDVFENEPNVPAALLALDNAVLLPHVGSASRHTRQAMGDLMIANLNSWRDGKGPLTPVPETPWRAG